MEETVKGPEETTLVEAQAAEEPRAVKAEKLVNKYVFGSAGVGFIPIPILDFAGLAALQLKMLKTLSGIYEVEFKDDRATYIISTLVGSVVPTGIASGVARSVGAIPFIGPVLGATSMPLLYGASTYALARVMIQHLESGGTFLTFDPEKVKTFFKEQYTSGVSYVKKIGKSAKAKVQPQVEEPATA